MLPIKFFAAPAPYFESVGWMLTLCKPGWHLERYLERYLERRDHSGDGFEIAQNLDIQQYCRLPRGQDHAPH